MTAPSKTLMYLLLGAPWLAAEPGVGRVIHAATMKMLTSPTGEMESPCGVAVKLLPLPWPDGEAVPWPPQHRLPPPMTRCRECWVATGRKRPRSRLEVGAAPSEPLEAS